MFNPCLYDRHLSCGSVKKKFPQNLFANCIHQTQIPSQIFLTWNFIPLFGEGLQSIVIISCS
uniref:Uncharacterized protein n=1 Tax=Daphnia magna TaxID=35525 RepID=A0A0P6C3Z0_9CRUS